MVGCDLEMKEKRKGTPAVAQKCSGCGGEFPSRNAVFKHLRATDGSCLSGRDLIEFRKYAKGKDKGIKAVILFGYLPVQGRIGDGDDAAVILLNAIQQFDNAIDGVTSSEDPSASDMKYSRSYGNSQRTLDVVAQDKGTGAITEVLAARLPRIRGQRTPDQWVDAVQQILNDGFSSNSPCPIQIFGRHDIPHGNNFNAEIDVTHRRVDYLLPVEFISWNTPEFRSRLESLPKFNENAKSHRYEEGSDLDFERADDSTVKYLFTLKKMMQRLATQVVDFDTSDKAAVMEKKFSVEKKAKAKKGKRQPKKQKKIADGDEPSESKDDSRSDGPGQQRLLKRKRFHNFTPTLMAHEYLAYRRLDRLYHRATLRFPSADSENKPFILLSITGDLFLQGQVCRVIGVFLAMANHLIDPDIVDCMFDENYPHLIPTPPAPTFGMVAAEASYMTWEGKLKFILGARSADRYPDGWNQPHILERVQQWREYIHETIARQWVSGGRDEALSRLNTEKEWTDSVLLPWVEKAKEHLAEYRQWRKSQDVTAQDSSESQQKSCEDGLAAPTMLGPPLKSVDSTVPKAFEAVLYHLRRVDESGQWPSTTLKRQLVMISTADSEEARDLAPTSLSVAHQQARNNKLDRSSAYDFAEGQGGASGSFSVGLMPGDVNKQPKSNFLFPELVKAAFELERVLCPDREPSSTIAINRNAQFRPHTDSGAGAGQSTSLIVGLGTYAGGELMVEGEKHDIRYKAIEFNGWKQRHWTCPFVGERYSLVWFTPKGCEGLRGIDLDLTNGPDSTATGSDTNLSMATSNGAES